MNMDKKDSEFFFPHSHVAALHAKKGLNRHSKISIHVEMRNRLQAA
jgi:hypothetical protein